MPSKKKKYNARFPPARIKKIMQTDEEIGKVAAAVPVIISRALELFLESLLRKACHVTQSRNAKTMTTSHLGRRPGRRNGGPGGPKGKDPKQSGTDTEQEEDSEDSDSDGDEEPAQPLPPQPPLGFPSPGLPFPPLGPAPMAGGGGAGVGVGLPPAPPPRG
ncbi:dr1-associated corepressor isoform X2 [Patagioenas fasciata]|uniref:dr1-associated corepressor isoform X2 n=1 Tax=Patagioenas fasciata TaxID=372321 RepID=UPI003A9A57C7